MIGKPPTVRKSLSITEKSDARRRHMEEVRARKKAGESQQQEGKKHCAHPAGVGSDANHFMKLYYVF